MKVAKPRKLIGVVDTTFARFNMGDAAQDELQKQAGEYDVMRRTVPGIKDLAVECKILLEEEDCDLVVACGMVGGQPIDKQCAHEASLAIQWAMLATNRHILEVFVHEDEAKDENQLAWLMDRRTREHAVNAHWMVQEPGKLRQMAGQGLRQGFDDAGPARQA
ncbi:MAG TPA: riboflavin synthase [Candidatus Thermoplasmatota archaeon]